MSSNRTPVHRALPVACAFVVALWSSAAVQAQPRPDATDGRASANETVIRRFWEAFNRSEWSGLDALVSAEYRHHPPGRSLTLDQFKDGGKWVHRGLADYELRIEALVEQNDVVATRWTARGTHVGSFFGEKPTGREISVRGMHFHRMVDGKIAEDWEVIDFDGFKRQLSGP